MFRTKTTIASAIVLASSGLAHAGDINISGFLSAGGGSIADEELCHDVYPVGHPSAGQPNTDTSCGYAGYESEDFTFDVDSLVGIQITGNVSDKMAVTAQLVARGQNDNEVTAEWAYVAYTVNDNFKWRMGRLRTPFYMLSDYVDVGYAYNWISAPSEVYYLPFNNVQGMDALFNFTAGSFDGLVQAYAGAFTDSFTLSGVDVSTKSRNQTGISLQMNRDWLTLRAAYHRAELTLDVPNLTALSAGVSAFCTSLAAANAVFPGFSDCGTIDYEKFVVNEDDGTFLDAAISVDTGRFLAVAETATFKLDNSPFSEDKRSYLMVGIRFGDIVLHATYAKADDKSQASDMLEGLPADTGTSFTAGHPLFNTQQALATGLAQLRAGAAYAADSQVDEHTTNTIGMRWDFTSSAVFKLQYDILKRDDVDDQKLIRFAFQSVF